MNYLGKSLFDADDVSDDGTMTLNIALYIHV